MKVYSFLLAKRRRQKKTRSTNNIYVIKSTQKKAFIVAQTLVQSGEYNKKFSASISCNYNGQVVKRFEIVGLDLSSGSR